MADDDLERCPHGTRLSEVCDDCLDEAEDVDDLDDDDEDEDLDDEDEDEELDEDEDDDE